MVSASNVNKSSQLRCSCGKPCTRRPGTSAQYRGMFILSCVNNEIPRASCCQVFLGETELDSFVKLKFAEAVEQADYHKKRHDEMKDDYWSTVDELEEARNEIGKLKRMNKTLQFSLAATAPVAASLAVASAWLAK